MTWLREHPASILGVTHDCQAERPCGVFPVAQHHSWWRCCCGKHSPWMREADALTAFGRHLFTHDPMWSA